MKGLSSCFRIFVLRCCEMPWDASIWDTRNQMKEARKLLIKIMRMRGGLIFKGNFVCFMLIYSFWGLGSVGSNFYILINNFICWLESFQRSFFQFQNEMYHIRAPTMYRFGIPHPFYLFIFNQPTRNHKHLI